MSNPHLDWRQGLSVLALLPALSGAGGQEPLPLLDEYHIRVFTVADGLQGSDVLAIAQDGVGYLYVAGGRGLARFDGYGFEPVALAGFRSRWIEQARTDAAGRLWLLTRTDDLGYIRGDRFEVLPPPPVPVTQISATADGAVWLGGPEGLVRVDPESDPVYTRYTTADGLPTDSVGAVFDAPGGGKIATTSRMLVRLVPESARPGGLAFVPFGPALPPWLLSYPPLADSAEFWIPADDGVLRWRSDSFTRWPSTPANPGVPLDSVRACSGGAVVHFALAHRIAPPAGYPQGGELAHRFLCASDGTRWRSAAGLGGRRRAELLRERGGQVARMGLRERLEFVRIGPLLEDREGGIWVGTDRGVVQLSPRRAAALTRAHGLAESFTTAVLQTRDGAVWIGSWGGGAHRFAGGTLTRRITDWQGMRVARVRTLFESADGTLWLGSHQGLAADEDRIRGWPLPEVRAITEARDHTGRPVLWVAARDGPRVLREGNPAPVAYRPDIAWGTELWAIHAAADGSVWVGGDSGLFRIAGDSIRRFGRADGLGGEFVVSIHEEPDGTLWFGTYEHGLHRYRDGRFARVTTREGLHHDGVWTMLPDDSGGVWMSSDFGIFRVNADRLHRVADAVEAGRRPEQPLDPVVFTEAEGLPSRESNRASPGGVRLADGRLVFNNIAGVVVIDPARAMRPLPGPRTVVQRVLADGEPMRREGARARLPTGTRYLAFDFAALSFAAPAQNRYRYRLDGYDPDWVDTDGERRVAFSALPPGGYTFRVQGAAGAGSWGDEARVAFVVPALYWQTWWFRLGLVVLAGALLTAAYRYRVNRLLEVQRLRLRIAADLHDDVGSNLSSIAMLSEMLRERAGPDGLERRQLERIRSAAGETIGALREIIWLVDPHHDNVADLVARMRGTATTMLNGTALEFRAPEALPDRRLDHDLVRQVFLIYKEALHNMVKHADARRVRIEVGTEGELFVLRIEDDGVGFREDDVALGLGLESMRRRARESGGELAIESPPGLGTRIEFRVRMA